MRQAPRPPVRGTRPHRVPSWALLTGAVVLEVLGTASLRLSDGLARPVFAVGVFTCYTLSIILFAQRVDRGGGLGVAYGTLTACGLLAATGLSALVFHEAISPVQVVGVLVLLVGLLTLQVPEKERP